MYKNPFAIKPGEKLTPQQLFERYVDWHNYNESNPVDMSDNCHTLLNTIDFCCKDHFQLRAENDVFFRYFHHLAMTEYTDMDFSVKSMIQMIKSSGLKIGESLREKLVEYWGDFDDLFLEKLNGK